MEDWASGSHMASLSPPLMFQGAKMYEDVQRGECLKNMTPRLMASAQDAEP